MRHQRSEKELKLTQGNIYFRKSVETTKLPYKTKENVEKPLTLQKLLPLSRLSRRLK